MNDDKFSELDLVVEDLSVELLGDQLSAKAAGGTLSTLASLSTYSCASCPACIATASTASTVGSAAA